MTQDCGAQLLLKDFGSFDEVWADNVVCRQIHVLLTASRPDVSQSISSIFRHEFPGDSYRHSMLILLYRYIAPMSVRREAASVLI